MLAEPNCRKRNCKHFEGVVTDDGDESTERVVCKAFPNGIPDEIAYGDNRHIAPFKGDGGIQYEVRDGNPSDRLDAED